MSGETPLFTVKIADNNYVLNFSGDQIAEAIRRMIEFDPAIIGTTRIESTVEKPCDLDLLRSVGSYFIDYVKHGPLGTEDVCGIKLVVCTIDDVLHQVMYVNDDIYVRSFDADLNTFNEWDSYSFGTTIYDGNVPPVELEIGTLWVDTSGKLPQLKRWDGERWVQFSPVGPGEMSEFIRNDVMLTSDLAIIPTGIKQYDKSKGHLLLCFVNSTLMIDSKDYEVLSDGLHIKKIDGTWVGTPTKPIMFTFVLLIPGISSAGEGSGTSEETEEEIKELKKRIELLQLYLQELEDKIAESGEASEETIKTLQETIDTLKVQLEAANKSIDEMEKQIATNESEITALKKNQNSLQNQITELKKIIESGGGGGGGGVIVLPDNLVYWVDAENGESSEVSIISLSDDSSGTTTTTTLPDNLVYFSLEDESGTL